MYKITMQALNQPVCALFRSNRYDFGQRTQLDVQEAHNCEEPTYQECVEDYFTQFHDSSPRYVESYRYEDEACFMSSSTTSSELLIG